MAFFSFYHRSRVEKVHDRSIERIAEHHHVDKGDVLREFDRYYATSPDEIKLKIMVAHYGWMLNYMNSGEFEIAVYNKYSFKPAPQFMIDTYTRYFRPESNIPAYFPVCFGDDA